MQAPLVKDSRRLPWSYRAQHAEASSGPFSCIIASEMGPEMSLKVIAAGWSRTGTFSLRLALQQLGLGPCYHMHEVFLHPEHHALWRRAAAGKLDSWNALFAEYQSVADTPVPDYGELSSTFMQSSAKRTSPWYVVRTELSTSAAWSSVRPVR